MPGGISLRVGFAAIYLIILLLLVIVFAIGFFSFQHRDSDKVESSPFGNLVNKVTSENNDPKGDARRVGKSLSGGKCEGEGVPYKLSHLPMDPGDFSIIIPYGAMIGDHVTPIDHQYFSPADYKSSKDAYPVYAMADSKIVDIEVHPTRIRLVFSITCTYFYYYDLVTSVEPKVNQKNLPVEVKAGELIGRIGGQTLDFAVWDTTKKLSGFVIPEHYDGERWKIYTVDPFEYYTDDLKQKALERYVRTVEPVSGKIDHDVDGKLIGNWFLEGANGYGGGGRLMDYFKAHLSFSPDVYDPSHFIVSVGSLSGEGQSEDRMQHMTVTNSPFPSEVGVDNGLVKYDLVSWEYMTSSGMPWDKMSMVKGISAKPDKLQVFGCALVQMIEARKLKFETVVGKSCSGVSGFSNSSKIYER